MFRFFRKNKSIEIVSPVTGKIIPIEEVPDQVFSEKMIGDGLAIDPKEGRVLSPIDGEVVTIFPTNHAIGLVSKEGLEILIHIGIDTVELNGVGFTRIIEKDSKVKKGDLLVEFDIDLIKEKGKSPITPVIISNMDKVENIDKIDSGETVGGETVIFTIELA
ncbi:PTS sugar transporter subunit IIA [Tepidimicrobium xylanilyticum]|uniref:PTS system IIA component, Glc family (TC 4.A.1) n=1 Tax=Tepidimicrobium xylanilyticum TaxID=1123352 RepID=A0A1H3DYS5_9FIRM|nr:PTS glucose transporter subunit IIA [Tepidimicrobium xylanilyticum]SDX71622.1 PTS system IIA component, Glc family (TC 4.A.1) [Tepidimicrobium xylanilyticum]